MAQQWLLAIDIELVAGPSAIGIDANGEGAGPPSTAPVVALKIEPWQGQTNASFCESNCTRHPARVQMVENARNWPLAGWDENAGMPCAGSVNDAAPPTGKSLAVPSRVPFVFPVAPGAAVVNALDADVGDPPNWGSLTVVGADGATSRPRPATMPPSAASIAPSVPMATNRRRITRRSISPGRRRAREELRAAAAMLPLRAFRRRAA